VQSYARKKGVITQQAFTDSIITNSEIENGDYQGARQIYRRCLLFPLYPMLSRSEIETISKVLSTLP
jgi:dTDP-4-amino-4,6-dideoxygalactose transaminase